jgi:hypothetical protein
VLSLAIALGWILLNKRLMDRHSPVVVTAYGLLLGTLMLLVWVPLRYGLPPVAHVSMKAWLVRSRPAEFSAQRRRPYCGMGHDAVPASQAGVLLNMEPLDRQPAWRLRAGRAFGAECVDRRRADSRCGDYADDTLQSSYR